MKLTGPQQRPARDARRGAALILVLWVVGLLAMLVASFAFEAHIESRMTSFYRTRTKAEFHARSGLDVAELLVRKSNGMGRERDEEQAAEDIWYDPAFTLAEGGTVQLVHDMAEAGLGEGLIRLAITPEESRRNLNQLREPGPRNDETWERILDVGGVPQEMWPTLIDSFYDWTNVGEAPRPDGAKTDDYYALLDPPYRAREGPLDTVGELLLIRGFTREILDGGVIHSGAFESDEVRVSGIGDMLTTYGDGKVNVNAASARVLMTLPEVDAILADYIVSLRQEWVDDAGGLRRGFEDVPQFLSLVPEFPVSARERVTTDSGVFRVTSTGELHGVVRTIWCIVQFDGNRYLYLRWREDD